MNFTFTEGTCPLKASGVDSLKYLVGGKCPSPLQIRLNSTNRLKLVPCVTDEHLCFHRLDFALKMQLIDIWVKYYPPKQGYSIDLLHWDFTKIHKKIFKSQQHDNLYNFSNGTLAYASWTMHDFDKEK